MSWIGKPMMNPIGLIGKVVGDENGNIFRFLTVEFKNNKREELILANVGPNPMRSRKWKWFYTHDGKEEWVEWGQ